MFLFKKRKKAKPVDVARIRLQVEMVQVGNALGRVERYLPPP